ncbi:MAG TPA: hypothetical protein VLB69_03130, partial [Rudaea sp.]|nr:hypothetical protein [Rudaea sp.]
MSNSAAARISEPQGISRTRFITDALPQENMSRPGLRDGFDRKIRRRQGATPKRQSVRRRRTCESLRRASQKRAFSSTWKPLNSALTL